MTETLNKIKYALKDATDLYLVGGCVRDEILNKPNKDIDILVTGMHIPDIIEALKPISQHVDVEGESFSAVKAVIDSENFDFVIPRTEQSTGSGHKDFKVIGDPFLSPEHDANRRDFTMNAIMKNLRTVELFDPTGGLNDIKNKTIRAVGNPNDRFSEDALRMLRALQFASRLEFDISPETLNSIKLNANFLLNVSKERIFEEFNKAFTKSKDTGKLIELLKYTRIGEILFGKEFNPRVVSLSDVVSTMRTNYGFISFFFDGGDPYMMNSTNEQLYYLQLAINLESSRNPFDYGYVRNRKDLECIASLKQFFSNNSVVSEKIDKISRSIMLSHQLAVSAEELINFGIVQNQLGIVMKRILKAIYDGLIENEKNDILKFIQ